MRKVFVGAAMVLALAVSGGSAAFAASEATLATPLAKPRIVVVDGKVWKCTGVTCTSGRNAGVDQPARRECVRVKRRLGTFTAYARDGVALSVPQLEQCIASERSDAHRRGGGF